jgi:hypothetical protein
LISTAYHWVSSFEERRGTNSVGLVLKPFVSHILNKMCSKDFDLVSENCKNLILKNLDSDIEEVLESKRKLKINKETDLSLDYQKDLDVLNRNLRKLRSNRNRQKNLPRID